MLSTQTLERMKKEYQRATGAMISYEALAQNAGYHGLNNTANFFYSQAEVKRCNAKAILWQIASRGEMIRGPIAIMVRPEIFQAKNFLKLFEVARDIEEDLSQEVYIDYTQAITDGEIATSLWISDSLIKGQVTCEQKVLTILDRLRVRMGDGLQGGASTVELDPAEVHGEVIHDIDVWIGQTFGGS